MKACLLSGIGDYLEMESNLQMYVERFTFEREVKPRELFGTKWHFYVVDTAGMLPLNEIRILEDVADLIRKWPKKAIVIWTEYTWGRLCEIDREAAAMPNCLRCDIPGWVEKMAKNVRRIKRHSRDFPGE